MKAITTKYLGPTDTKPSRIKAFDEAGNQVTVSLSSLDYNHDYDAHSTVALMLVNKMGWGPVKLHTGGVKGGYVHVMEYI